MLKKAGVLISYGNLYSSYSYASCPPQITTPNSSMYPRPLERQKCQHRAYTTLRSEKLSSEDLQWPDSATVPTPYQIFQLHQNSSYSKRRFYELVKLYHPDRHLCGSGLSLHVRTERYRLVVAANEILSDPVKRSAYDKYGSGWDSSSRFYSDKRSGSDLKSSPTQNATWEDWEKWYQRDGHDKQESQYFSNEVFISLVFLVVVLGAIGQATRVGDHTKSFLNGATIVHDDCIKSIESRRRFSQNRDTGHERMQNFLKARDPYDYGTRDSKDEIPHSFLPPPEA